MKYTLKAYLRLVVVIAAVGAVAGCQRVLTVVTDPATLFHSQPKDLGDSLCNPTDATLATDRGYTNDAINFARANGYYGWCIPEFDDDQRLSDGNLLGKDYGPIAHVLAAPWLDTLTFNTDFRQVAILVLDAPPTSAEYPYTQLRLGLLNCVYLRHPTPADTGFESLIVPPLLASNTCPSAPTPGAGAAPLAVAMEQPAGLDTNLYPATTRFIEAGDGRTLIGVRCTNHWCAVRPSGNAAAETVTLEGTISTNGPSTSPGTGIIPPSAQNGVPGFSYAQALVKGWFDDQYLGVPDTRPNHHIHRQIRASAIPDPNLGNLRLSDFIPQPPNPTVYQPVGTTYFSEEPDTGSKYAKVFGFSQGVNLVAMRGEIKSNGDTVWFTRVINARGQVKDSIPTTRMDHTKYFGRVFPRGKIPATMRWRWSDGDEDLWAECVGGCCLAGIQ